MLNLDLTTIAQITTGRLHGRDVRITEVSTDSRQSSRDALFVALRGENHDAHDFVEAAKSQGACAALVERQLDIELPQVIVADSQIALGQLAGHVRRERELCVIGITGSNGKTTVKTLLAGILGLHAPTHFSVGSFNNEIGLPLTLLATPEDAQFVVLEMGAGKPGDIAYLVQIALPQIGLVNNIAPAHLERMGSLEGVASTKGALYSGLPAHGIAVINADDTFAPFFIELASGRTLIRFGLGEGAEVTARFTPTGPDSEFTLVTPIGEIEISTPLLGLHNVLNALAASSLALAVDVPLATIKAGLEGASAVSGRSARRLHSSGATIIDDTYNANPASFSAAINTLAACTGTRILVVGDMRELGPDGERLHAETGALALNKGIDRLYAVGDLSRAAAQAFGNEARYFENQESLIRALEEELKPDATLLVKGSRGSAMDRVVRALFGDEIVQGDRHVA
ncbi:MAG TPA: UDP-N-acetylmuramoyl-tripeptide--D-alanyl-D-alanine ligase [Dokdonella sp.]|uniref:UDP-N-acetylmuramoyl-tripeptide--D-alanyl-D- alanine ligase n=1 Tax=Dokdonella sp. TaxID=2291710 RepID=UPI002D7E8E51|nr:UDP-N-acetylmuramoyl-tripeptide--D-alanyl-D-alanine ligase [Dokdonella sp.]HET9031915.1 UDP-N-acetylmuramoyl-tripeptide--D-alanyl-D-alanine ligase [Dokdonella sp.]